MSAGFQWAGDLTGAAPVVRNFQIAANVYQGQLLRWDVNAGGIVEPCAACSAAPEAANIIAGICTGIVTSPSYDSTYHGDLGTYDTTQATQLANRPIGAAMAQVTMLTPSSLIKGPIVKDTIGTAPERAACTTTVTNGLTFVIDAIDTSVSHYSTAYCAKGANRGHYRIITTGATATQTMTIAFPYTITAGDIFVVANIRQGLAHIELDSQFQGIDSSDDQTHYFVAYVHELNLEEEGKEYAVFSLSPRHFL